MQDQAKVRLLADEPGTHAVGGGNAATEAAAAPAATGTEPQLAQLRRLQERLQQLRQGGEQQQGDVTMDAEQL